jgi:hypothetical protein
MTVPNLLPKQPSPSGPPYGGGTIYGSPQYGIGGAGLQFFDETGLNPLPAGILVTIINTTTAVLVGAAWTQPGGYCNVNVGYNVQYTASFSLSSQAPSGTVSFTPVVQTGQAFPVTVAPYRSPSLSESGYAALQTAKLVRGWFGDTAIAPGGIAYAICYAIAAGLADMDAQTQANLSMMRLQSSLGGDIDSWSLDMVGPTFGRYPLESDQLFIARSELMVARPRCTINAIQALVIAFYTSILAGWSVAGSEALGLGTAGSLDISGGLDVPPVQQPPKTVPPILVWDSMTQPQWAQSWGLLPLQFVIQIGIIYTNLTEQLSEDVAGGLDTSGGIGQLVGQGSLPSLTNIPPDPRLGTMVNLIAKGAGTTPLYLVGSY